MVEQSGSIYYLNPDDKNKLYKRNMDGIKNFKIIDSYLGSYCLDGEWIYFTFMSYGIYRMKIDGTEEQKLIAINWMDSPFMVNGNWIFFPYEMGLSKIKTDGTEKTRLYEDIYGIGQMLSIKDGRIYYENTIEEGGGYYN